MLDVQQEKQHNQFIQSVEGFNTEVLRKTETVEKSVLPNAEGNLIRWKQQRPKFQIARPEECYAT